MRNRGMAFPGQQQFGPNAALQGQEDAMLQSYQQDQNVPTAEQFLPPNTPSNQPLQIPTDYTGFRPANPGQLGVFPASVTPQQPVIQNLGGDVPGQYVQDLKAPEALVKSQRGGSMEEDRAILNGRPGFSYQIDHIVPLELGGADTLANREVLTNAQNDLKTKAQAVPYTLYAHGQISLAAARAMAAQWKDRDVTGLPEPDQAGLVPIDTAKEIQARWSAPPEPTAKDFWSSIPKVVKGFGSDWGAATPVSDFIKGAANTASFGFIPYEEEDNAGTASKVAGFLGKAAGALASFTGLSEGLGALGLGARAIGKLASFGVKDAVGDAAVTAAKETLAQKGVNMANNVAQSKWGPVAAVGKLGKSALSVDPSIVKSAIKLGGVNVLDGQLRQLVANYVNPQTLAGGQSGSYDHPLMQAASDFTLGALSGVMPPTMKGAVGAAAIPMVGSLLSDPYDLSGALAQGVLFGSLHYMGSGNKIPGFSTGTGVKTMSRQQKIDVMNKNGAKTSPPDDGGAGPSGPTGPVGEGPKGPTPPGSMNEDGSIIYAGPSTIHPDIQSSLTEYEQQKQQEAASIINNFNPEFTNGKWDDDTPAHVKNALDNLDKLYFFGINPDGTPAKGAISLEQRNNEMARILAASRQLYRGTLDPEARAEADAQDVLSITKLKQQENDGTTDTALGRPAAVTNAFEKLDPALFNESLLKHSTPKQAGDSGQYPTGTSFATGGGLEAHTPRTKEYMDLKARGLASQSVIIYDAPELSHLQIARNNMLENDPSLSKNGAYSVDPNPDKNARVFGIAYPNGRNAPYQLYDLGSLPSNGRLNTNSNAMNKGIAPNDRFYLNLNKDDVVTGMRQQGLPILVANLGPRAASATKKSGNPFVHIDINDQNWEYSKAFNESLNNSNAAPESMSTNLARVRTATNAKAKSQAINQIRNQVQQSSSALIPRAAEPKPIEVPLLENKPKAGLLANAPKAKQLPAQTMTRPQPQPISVPQEVTRNLQQKIEGALQGKTAAEVQAAFKSELGVNLDDSEAQALYLNRNDLSVKDMYNKISEKIENGQTDGRLEPILKMFVKPYLESESFKNSEVGPVYGDMRVLGGIAHRVEPTPTTPEIAPKIAQDASKAPETISPTSDTPTTQPEASQEVTGASEQPNDLASAIASAHSQEAPYMGEVGGGESVAKQQVTAAQDHTAPGPVRDVTHGGETPTTLPQGAKQYSNPGHAAMASRFKEVVENAQEMMENAATRIASEEKYSGPSLDEIHQGIIDHAVNDVVNDAGDGIKFTSAQKEALQARTQEQLGLISRDLLSQVTGLAGTPEYRGESSNENAAATPNIRYPNGQPIYKTEGALPSDPAKAAFTKEYDQTQGKGVKNLRSVIRDINSGLRNEPGSWQRMVAERDHTLLQRFASSIGIDDYNNLGKPNKKTSLTKLDTALPDNIRKTLGIEGVAPVKEGEIAPGSFTGFTHWMADARKAPPTSTSRIMAETLNKALKDISKSLGSGEDYAKSEEIKAILDTKTPQGKFFWEKMFSTTNKAGRPIEQPKGVGAGFKAGNMKQTGEEIEKKRAKNAEQQEEMSKNGAGDLDTPSRISASDMLPEDYQNMSLKELKSRPVGEGLHLPGSDVSGEDFSQKDDGGGAALRVKKPQEDMETDLTYGESRGMLGFAQGELDGKTSATDAVNLIKNFMLDKDGLIAAINKEKKGKQAWVNPKTFATMLDDAKKIDTERSHKAMQDKEKANAAKKSAQEEGAELSKKPGSKEDTKRYMLQRMLEEQANQ